MVREIGSPMPIPSGLVVKNGSKTCESFSAAMPCPVSLTAISTVRAASTRALTRDAPTLRAGPVQGVHAIKNEIEQHLLEMHAVAAH